MTLFNRCVSGSQERRRRFWVTQPNACAAENDNCDTCARPGLNLICNDAGQVTINNDNYVTGLVLNILLTDARKPDNGCGYTPGTRGGFWADSFRTDGLGTGSKLRQISVNKSVRDIVSLAKAYAQDDLNKLVAYGVAKSVKVEADYKGSNRVGLTIIVSGEDGTVTKVGVQGERIKNSWVWSG